MTEALNVRAVLGRILDLYGKQIGVLFPAALILFIPAAIIATLLVLILNPVLLGSSTGPGPAATLITLVAIFPIMVVGVWYVGVVVAATEDMEDGTREISVSGLLQDSARYIPRLVGAGLLVMAVVISLGVLATLPDDLLPTGLLTALFVLAAIYLLLRWALIAPAIVIEEATVTGALRRSWSLVGTRLWHVLAVFLVVYLLITLIGTVFSLAGSLVGESLIIQQLIRAIANALLVPVAALTNAIVFFELRRIEG